MPTTPQPLDKPTRRTIEMLLRDLVRSNYETRKADKDYQNHELFEAKCEAILDRARNTPSYKRFKKAAEMAWSRHYTRKRTIEVAANTLRQHYLANGITPYLIRELNKLITR